MPTVLELAEYAGVSTETVVRVLLREPTNERARQRVSEAVAALGLPEYPRPDQDVEVLPAADAAAAVGAAPVVLAAGAPVVDGASIMAELRSVFADVLEGLRRERRERIDDVALTNELVIEGWRNVDRRLGRLEKIVERLDRYAYFGGDTGRMNGNGSANGNGANTHRSGIGGPADDYNRR